VEGHLANVRGPLSARAHVVWAKGKLAADGAVGSTGLDFDAPVGPVRGLAGQVELTDLLGLVTAPHQHLRIASINPGVEVSKGEVDFAMEPGLVLNIERAHWPFLDGALELTPTRLQLGGTKERRFEVKVERFDAAQFLARMDMPNLAMTGQFDGRLPLVFDANGGRIEGGELVSRGGGSVSYVGELSYRDLSAMANYTFAALRSLRYQDMKVALNGSLSGDLVTAISLSGLSQGKGASRNFITRQVANLPLRFDVNIRAPFYLLVSQFRGGDQAAVARLLGIDGHDGAAAAPAVSQPASAAISPVPKPARRRFKSTKLSSIQPSVSESKP
jgi:hypothetical protein